MELQVSITAITQEMQLESGTSATYLVLRLSSGELLRALIDDEGASAVVQLAVAQNGAPRPRAVPTAPSVRTPRLAVQEEASPPVRANVRDDDDEEGHVHVFGGDGGEDEASPTVLEQDDAPAPPAIELPAELTVASPPAPGPSRVQVLPSGKRVVPSRTIAKDEAGNPIVRVREGVDPGLTKGPGTDEDGVAQA
jgi:hypothetical protein